MQINKCSTGPNILERVWAGAEHVDHYGTVTLLVFSINCLYYRVGFTTCISHTGICPNILQLSILKAQTSSDHNFVFLGLPLFIYFFKKPCYIWERKIALKGGGSVHYVTNTEHDFVQLSTQFIQRNLSVKHNFMLCSSFFYCDVENWAVNLPELLDFKYVKIKEINQSKNK